MITTVKNVSGLRVIRAMTDRFPDRELYRVVMDAYPDADIATVQQTNSLISTSGTLFIDSPTKLRIFNRGIRGKQGGVNVALGYSYGNVRQEKEGFNSWLYDNARVVLDRLAMSGFRGYKRVEIHGHSAGGVVAEALAKLLARIYFGVTLEIYTYGSPAPSHSGCCLSGERVTRERWMATDDAVPLVPWCNLGPDRFLGLYLFNLATGTGGATEPRPNLFVQPGQGFRMEENRIVSAQTPRTTSNQAIRVQQWLDGDEDAQSSHSVTNYLNKLSQYSREFPRGLEPGDAFAGEVEAPSTNVVIPFPLVLPDQTEEQQAVPIRIGPASIAFDPSQRAVGSVFVGETPMSFLKINPKKAFRRVKVGNQWQVVIGQTVVMVTDTPKVPRTIVKRLNGMLRAVGTDNTVWLDSFLAGLQDWMTNAASDNTYCQPTMRVDL